LKLQKFQILYGQKKIVHFSQMFFQTKAQKSDEFFGEKEKQTNFQDQSPFHFWGKEQQIDISSLGKHEKRKKENFSFFSEKRKKNFQDRSKSSFQQTKTSWSSSKTVSSVNNKNSTSGIGRFSETQKQQVVSITYEEIGLFPRSFNRVFDRFFKQLFFDVENFVIQEYRFYRYLFLTTVKCLFILFFVPLSVNFLAKNYCIRPITEYFWNTQSHDIFLNSYQQKRAFSELKNFEEKIYFESFLFFDSSNSFSSTFNEEKQKNWDVGKSKSEDVVPASGPIHPHAIPARAKPSALPGQSPPLRTPPLRGRGGQRAQREGDATSIFVEPSFAIPPPKQSLGMDGLPPHRRGSPSLSTGMEKVMGVQTEVGAPIPIHLPGGSAGEGEAGMRAVTLDVSASIDNSLQKRLQTKIVEFAKHYNEESIEAVTNFFADLLSFGTLWFLLLRFEIQINITKSFLLEVFFGLDDSKKSLLLLFFTDLLVGYHSPNIWELFFQTVFDHYGLPESQTTIFLLVATLPVLLDVLFKYLIFRHLNRASPATVATYHAMIE
jgi:hypothetical protein